MRSTNGFTFGGYAAAAWNNGTGGHIAAAGSFVFWVQNPQGRAPGCLDCVAPATALWSGYSVQIAAGMIHSSIALIIVCACATPISQHLPLINPPPDTPTPPGWAKPSSLALHNSPPRTTRCGLPRDTPPPPPFLARPFQAADARAAFTHAHLRATNNKDSQYRACAASSRIYVR